MMKIGLTTGTCIWGPLLHKWSKDNLWNEQHDLYGKLAMEIGMGISTYGIKRSPYHLGALQEDFFGQFFPLGPSWV